MKKKKIIRLTSFFVGVAVLAAVLLFGAFPQNKEKTKTNDATAAISYVDSNPYITALLSDTSALDSNYSLAKIYPIYSENQTSSQLCWVYSSMKVLETSVMVQKNEYHNFAEMGTALLYYQNYKDSGTVSIDSTGDFEKFNLTTQEYGLIYENDLSNDIYFDINEDNYENYISALELADTKFMQNIKPISIKNDVLFSSQQLEVKTEVLKRYIKTYGGIFAGLEPGTILTDKIYINEVNKDTQGRYFEEAHAACIIGWDDNFGWLAVNSWGRANTDYNYFYIPYDYEHIYAAACGYIVLGGGEDVFISSSNASNFAQNVTKSDEALANIFCYDEDINLTYQISNEFDFDEIYVNIFSGTENVTHMFELDFSLKNHLTIKSREVHKQSLGGCYEVRIHIGETLISQNDFYVYTGVDLSYAELTKTIGATPARDSVQLTATMASGKNFATYYVSSGGSNDVNFDLYLYLQETATTYTTKATIDGIYEVADDGEETVTSLVQAGFGSSLNANQRHRITIKSLTRNNAGKLFNLKVSLQSTLGKTKQYNFKFFISSNEMVNSSSSNSIHYELGGGKNSAQNINRYPNFGLEMTAQSFTLQAPTKYASNFIGWYLDSSFTTEVTAIDETLSGDITLYAKWEVQNANYMEVGFLVSSLKHYGETTNITYAENMPIVYGDSVYLNFDFEPNKANLVSYNYYAKYHYYFGEKEISSNTLTDAASIYLPLEFPTLSAGNYSARLEVTMIISRSFSITVEKEIEFLVSPKQVTASFSNLNYIYDRQNHRPTATLNGVYKEDSEISCTVEDAKTAGVYEYKNVGNYTFVVSSVDSKNYTIAPNQTAEMIISKAELNLNWGEATFVYNGQSQVPTCQIGNTGDDLVDIMIQYYEGTTLVNGAASVKDVGSYRAVASIDNKNYKLTSKTEHNFTITPKNITIRFNNVEQRFTVAPNNRTGITFTVEGLAAADDVSSLNIKYVCEGLNADESGSYPITGTYNNPNYNAQIIEGTYKILGHYYVYYTLPDGTVYTEDVDDGYDPQGVPKDVYKVPLFGKIKYSEPLKYTGGDLYIKVSHTNYTWVVLVGVVVVAFVIIFWLSTRKARRNKNR